MHCEVLWARQAHSAGNGMRQAWSRYRCNEDAEEEGGRKVGAEH
jgi:hypothetical protein